MSEINILKIRNMIAAREFNTAQANRELALGGWRQDYAEYDRLLDKEIDKLMREEREEK